MWWRETASLKEGGGTCSFLSASPSQQASHFHGTSWIQLSDFPTLTKAALLHPAETPAPGNQCPSLEVWVPGPRDPLLSSETPALSSVPLRLSFSWEVAKFEELRPLPFVAALGGRLLQQKTTNHVPYTTEMYCLPVLESRSPRSRRPQGCDPSEGAREGCHHFCFLKGSRLMEKLVIGVVSGIIFWKRRFGDWFVFLFGLENTIKFQGPTLPHPQKCEEARNSTDIGSCNPHIVLDFQHCQPYCYKK